MSAKRICVLVVALTIWPIGQVHAAADALRAEAARENPRTRPLIELAFRAPHSLPLIQTEQTFIQQLLAQEEAAGHVTGQSLPEAVPSLIQQRTGVALTHPVELRVVDRGEAFGMPRSADDDTLPNLVFAFRQWEATQGVLRIYVTRAYSEQWLRRDALHLAAVVDQEAAEAFLALSHPEASKRMWKFQRTPVSLPPPYAFYLFQLMLEGYHDVLAAVDSPHANDPEQLFSSYAQQLLPQAKIVSAEKPYQEGAKSYFASSSRLQTAGPFTDALSAVRWLQQQRQQLPTLTTAEPLSLGYLMQALWIGGRLHDAQGQPVANVQPWIWLAAAADYALKRRVLIEVALMQLFDSFDPSQRERVAQQPRLLSRVQVDLTYLRDDAHPLEQRRRLSASYRRVVLRCVWALYGNDLWNSWLQHDPRSPSSPGASPEEPMRTLTHTSLSV